MHSQHQHLARSDSPPDHGQPNLLHQLHSQDPSYNIHSLQTGLYSNPNSMHLQSEYPHDFDTTKLQQQHSGKPNGFGANNFRASFSSFPNTNRPRHQLNQSVIGGPSFRDPHSFYPTSADVFPPQVTSPVQSHLQPYDPHNSFDFGSGQAGLVSSHKSYLDNFNSPSNLLHTHHGTVKSGMTTQQPPHPTYNTANYHNNPVQLASQTPYGPHLPANVLAGGNVNQGVPPNITAPASMGSTVGANNSNQEEISTIFVVGFPEDMQEREFQNMFTFSPGFEAATLKIPNKEYTAYSGIPSGTNGLRSYQGYNGSNDPYNLVTVNQGGVVVDGGRDGTMSSWPAAVPGDDGTGHFLGGSNVPPRKQIIGFAKFRSREEALAARDVLQGRRVDIEKGAVLKAEMAKKNLHTKRGVGPVPGAAAATAPVSLGPTNPLPNLQHINGVSLSSSNPDTFNLPTDPYPSRDRDAGPPLGGINLGRLGAWRDQLQQDVHAVTNGIGAAHSAEFIPRKDREDDEQRRRERDANLYSAMGFGSSSSTRGPRERAEEDERDRRRREKDARLRATNSTAFDAFHSVPAGSAPALSRQTSGANDSNGNSLLPPMEGSSSLSSSPLLANAYATTQSLLANQFSQTQQQYQSVDELVGPWDTTQQTHQNGSVIGPHSSSQRSTSPHEGQDPRYSPSSDGRPFGINDQHNRQHRSQSESSGSSVVGSQMIGSKPGGTSSLSAGEHNADAGLSRTMNDLILSTENGNTSPELPSPASGASSVSTRNAIDQNPPINTLYVGNLPTSPPPLGFPQDYLEESLRQLFSVQPGFRRLCFRQKSNGPMCFVEFEDVNHASKALNDLYGNTLKGLIKGGGIRLSYSKNPLGVRTPTSATGSSNGSLQQQQVMQSMTFHPDQFQPRIGDDYSQPSQQPPTILRREANHVSPPTGSSYNNSFLTSPPPRFSTSPPSNPFGVPPSSPLNNATSSFALRGNGGSLSTLYSYNLSASGGLGSTHSSSTTFSPFGVLTPSIPEQSSASDDPSSLHSSQHFIHRTLSPPVNNIEATRAG